MAEPVRFSLGLPAGWVELPMAAGDTAAAAGAAGGLAATEVAEKLTRLAELARRQNRPGRRHYVYLGVGETPSVRAWAHLELVAREGATVETVLARAAEPAGGPAGAGSVGAGDGVRPWRREAAAGVIAERPAAVVDDLLEVPSADGSRLHRRILITLFPADDRSADALALGDELVVQLQLSTPDLTAFDDPRAVAIAMAETLRFETATPEVVA